eukprot:Platyproteum_vivax@DN15657_c0_g1_i1.p2
MRLHLHCFTIAMLVRSFQCADVQHSQNRHWVRLVGLRHDLQLWASDTRPIQTPTYSRTYKVGGGNMHPAETWAAPIVDRLIARFFPSASAYLPNKGEVDQNPDVYVSVIFRLADENKEKTPVKWEYVKE